MWEDILWFLTEYTEEAGAAGGLVAVGLFVWGIVKKPFSKTKPTELAKETIDQIAPKQDGKMHVADFIRVRRELKADLEAELADAHEADKAILRDQIAELEKQLANPDQAFAEAQARIRELEALLERSGNEIGGDRLAEAREALEKGDYSIADALFEEIEERRKLEVQEAARAAYGRGEIAEAEIRWADAARHYERAAKLEETYATLRKVSEFMQRAGHYEKAARFSADLVALTKKSDDKAQYTNALNEHALNEWHLGHFSAAETAFCEALEIDRQTIGEEHPHFAIRLNNLAKAIRAQGRYEEAEKLNQQVLEIDRQTIGERHPSHATHLNNFAEVMRAQGRYEEAEQLFKQALDIVRQTIGEGHPDFAIHLNNLALVIRAQGRYEEAEKLYQQVLEIDRQTIGEGHPDYATRLNNLAVVIHALGRFEEAEKLYQQALEIDRQTIGEGHPEYARHLHNLALLFRDANRTKQARQLLEQALTIRLDRLGRDHPDTKNIQAALDSLPPPT